MKTLIAYYSFSRNNEKLANYLHQQATHSDIVKIEPVRKYTGLSIFLDLLFKRTPVLKKVPYYLRDYDHVVFIAPIWAEKIAMPLKAFLLQEKGNIRGDYSFVTLCSGGIGQKKKIQQQLEEITGKPPYSLVELWTSSLQPPDKKGSIRDAARYRIDPSELSQFDQQLREVLPPDAVAK